MFLFFFSQKTLAVHTLTDFTWAAQYLGYNFPLTKQIIKVPEYKLIQFLIGFLTFLDGWTFLSILGNIASLWIFLLKQHNMIKVVKTET